MKEANNTGSNQVATKRVMGRSSITTPSISGALRGKTSGGQNQMLNEPSQNAAYNEVTGNTPFTEEQLGVVWKKYVESIDSPQLKAALLTRKPQLGDNWQVGYALDNRTQEERISFEVKPRLLGYIRRSLRNAEIEIDFTIAEGTENVLKRPYSDTDKWQAMVDNNPALAVFKKKFGLDFDNSAS